MGKDREGKFHPRKAKPSDVRAAGIGLKYVSTDTYEANLDIAEKYTIGEEQPAPNVKVRHPNRNVDKKEERQQEKSSAKNTKAKRETFASHVKSADEAAAQELLISINKEEFNELANRKSGICISLYFPTHASGVEVNELQDPTLFKNKLQLILGQLRQKGVDDIRINKLLKPGFDLLRNDMFWRNLSLGLAVFISDGIFKYMKMPLAPREELLVNTSFYLAPLLPVLAHRDYFYLLVLSKKQAKFYRADAFGMVPLQIDELPNGVDDVVHFEEKDDQKLWRTGSNGAGGGANYHGIGAGKPDEKENLSFYFDEVDETLWEKVLHNEHVPLLLAGVEYLIPIYKSVAKYKPIWEDPLTGNHEREGLTTLYKLACEKMKPYFEERHKRALEMYANQSATELTSSIPEDVIPAAHYRRVWHLFIQKDQHLWGTFDEMNNKLVLHDAPQDGDECLLDKAALKTVLNAGEVHILPEEKMPARSKIAAVMRY